MHQYQPEPCAEDQFIDAQISNPVLGWQRAGNGESFKIAQESGFQNYVRTGKRYWTFQSLAILNHAELASRVNKVLIQERADIQEVS